MINGAHVMLYDRHADELRPFLRDVLGLTAVDAGDGWLILKLPPAEMGVHPTESDGFTELYFMCDDIEATVAQIEARGGRCGPRAARDWGVVTAVEAPGGRQIGLYQPRHPNAQ